MRRLVVTTASGRVVADDKVTEEQLADGVSRWMQVVPDCGVYVDGRLISDEVRRVLLGLKTTPTPAATPSPTAAPTSTAPTAPVEPEELRSAAEAMQYAFGGVIKGWRDLLDFTQDFTKRYGEQLLERDRQNADEAARQRSLTHTSLKDIDLLDRSIAATTFKDRLAAATANSTARVRQDDRMRVGDVVAGVLKMILGDRK